MSKARKPHPDNRPMRPFFHATVPPETMTLEYWLGKGLTPPDAEEAVNSIRASKVVMNDTYQVAIRNVPQHGSWPPMIWLSIKRRDKLPIHDWRELQQIKNMVVGPENEAVELYPAESRLADSANQYHLFCLLSGRFPFGFNDRRVQGPNEGYNIGAKQRPFPNGGV